MSAGSQSHTRRAEDKYAHLEKLAREEEAKALSEKDALFAKAKELHAGDLAGYTFECDHWGHFLNIKIARLGNTPKNQHYGIGQYYSGSINLNLVGAIELVQGHEPDLGSALTYRASTKYNEDTKDWDGCVYRQEPGFPLDRGLFFKEPKGERDNHGGMAWAYQNEPYRVKLTTPNWPRAAEDDQIKFPDIKAVIYAPAGMGAAVYKKILKATEIQKP